MSITDKSLLTSQSSLSITCVKRFAISGASAECCSTPSYQSASLKSPGSASLFRFTQPVNSLSAVISTISELIMLCLSLWRLFTWYQTPERDTGQKKSMCTPSFSVDHHPKSLKSVNEHKLDVAPWGPEKRLNWTLWFSLELLLIRNIKKEGREGEKCSVIWQWIKMISHPNRFYPKLNPQKLSHMVFEIVLVLLLTNEIVIPC